MSVGKIAADSDVRLRAHATRWGLAPIRSRASAAWDRGHRWATSLRLRLKPKSSLATGSVLVLLTLYLPTTVTSCGGPKKGYQLLLGQYDTFWPGLWTLDIQAPGRIFYALNLALAGLTLCLVLSAVYRGGILRKPLAVRCLFPIAGTISLFVLSDFSTLGFFFLRGPNSPLWAAVLGLPLLLILVSFLRPEFWRMRGFFSWALVIGAALFLFFGLDSLFFLGFGNETYLGSLVPGILYTVIPLGVWYRFGLSQRKERHARWEEIRPRMQALYTLEILFACFFLVAFGLAGSDLWGLLAYFVGIQLISLGYMQLWREANPLLSHGQVLNEYEEQ